MPNFTTAGSGREMFNIIERLDKDVFDPYIVTRRAGGALYDEIISKGYPVIVESFSAENTTGLFRKMKEVRRLAKIYKSYHFDIWQSFNWTSDFTEALVAHYAGAKYLYVKKNMNWERRAWKLKSLFSNAIIARNTTLLNTYFATSHLKKKTIFITGGVDTQRFTPGTESDIRSEFNIPADAFLISCIAQIVKVKDQATLIKAVAKLDNVYVILAGAHRDEEYVSYLKSLIEELGINNRVLLPGAVSKVNELLNASNLFVLPTTKRGGHEEGCPVALMEAMAAGTPCIATDVAGSRDLIEHQATGLLFEDSDVNGLTELIKFHITHTTEATKMAKNAHAMIHAKHTLEMEANAFINVYKNMCGIIQ